MLVELPDPTTVILTEKLPEESLILQPHPFPGSHGHILVLGRWGKHLMEFVTYLWCSPCRWQSEISGSCPQSRDVTFGEKKKITWHHARLWKDSKKNLTQLLTCKPFIDIQNPRRRKECLLVRRTQNSAFRKRRLRKIPLNVHLNYVTETMQGEQSPAAPRGPQLLPTCSL